MSDSYAREVALNSDRLDFDELLAALKRLDALLEQAIPSAQAAYGPETASEPLRGLYIGGDEVERLLACEPGAPTLQPSRTGSNKPLPDAAPNGSRLSWLKTFFGLSSFDVDLILIALAPEIDRRYERLYAYLQDHVSRRRPSVDLALNLLCLDAAARLERRIHFDPDAPLMRHGLIHLLPEPNYDHPSLLAHTIKLDEQITRFLLHQDGLDMRIAPFCQLMSPTAYSKELPIDAGTREALLTLADQVWEADWPLRLYFCGPEGVGKRQAATALAAEVGVSLLAVDLTQALATDVDFVQALQLVFRYAQLYDVILYLDGLDELRDSRAVPHQRLLDMLAQHDGLTILTGTQPWVPVTRHPLGLISIPFPIPDFAQRRDCWRTYLDAADTPLDEEDLDTVASRFRLTPAQIAESVATAQSHSRWHAATQSNGQPADQPTAPDLFSAARAQSGHDLDALACKIEPIYTWDDIVLPPDTSAQLREICQRVNQRHRVLGEWGFDRKLSLGKGITALFAGPSGTGKTMAAEIIARELGLDLFKIDLSGVVSKYIGETEKNLARIFCAAENSNAILFFDEADALFGKRSEVRDSHDRYANIEISYLLQKMEEYDGIAILATNLRQNLDESFIRRLAFTVHFPFPDEDSRQRIWAGIWPEETPLGDDVDLGPMASQFKLSGGNIKNIALAAAFLAAGDGRVVRMAHLRQAVQREYQKMGKILSEAELGEL